MLGKINVCWTNGYDSSQGTERNNGYGRTVTNLSDPAVEEALYDSETMRRFVGIDLGQEAAPSEFEQKGQISDSGASKL